MPDEQDLSEALDDSGLTDEYPPHEACALDGTDEVLPDEERPVDDEPEVLLLDPEDDADVPAVEGEADTTGPYDPDPDRAPAAAEEVAVHVIDP